MKILQRGTKTKNGSRFKKGFKRIHRLCQPEGRKKVQVKHFWPFPAQRQSKQEKMPCWQRVSGCQEGGGCEHNGPEKGSSLCNVRPDIIGIWECLVGCRVGDDTKSWNRSTKCFFFFFSFCPLTTDQISLSKLLNGRNLQYLFFVRQYD